MKSLVLGLGFLGLAFGSLGFGTVALRAQSTTGFDANGDPNIQSAEQKGPLSADALTNPVRLIQQLQSIPDRSAEDFAQEQDGQLNDAGAEFRRLQLERLGCTDAAAGPGPAVNPACTPQ